MSDLDIKDFELQNIDYNDKGIRVFKKSGRPIDPEQEVKFKEDWTVFYDKAAERAMLDMIKLQRFLSFGNYLLSKKYYTDVYVKNLTGILEKMQEVGQNLTIGLSNEGEMVGIFEDI